MPTQDLNTTQPKHHLVHQPLPPGPTAPALWQAIQLGKSPFGFLADCAERYGDTFTIQLPKDPPRVIFANAEQIKEVFALPPEAYDSSLQSVPINLGESSVLFLDGERHHKERKLLMPPLHGERLRSFGALMQELTNATIEQWSPGQQLNIHPKMQDITLAVIVQCVFGVMDQTKAKQLKELVVTWLEGTLSPSVFMASTLFTALKVRHFLERQTQASLQSKRYQGRKRRLPWHKLADAKAEVVALLQAEIQAVKAAPEVERSDILAMLVETVDEAGEHLDDAHIIDELLTLLVGGHETTANSLCWALYHILQHPDAVQKIRAEILEVCGTAQLDVAQVNKLKYLGACIDESMRLSPIAPAVSRNLTQDTTIGGQVYPAGTILWPCVYLAQRHKGLWKDEATSFQPERFLDARYSASEYFPFGGGKRRCLGAAFAQYEMRIILGELLTRTDITLAPGFTTTPVIRGITVVPEGGISIQVKAIHPA